MKNLVIGRNVIRKPKISVKETETPYFNENMKIDALLSRVEKLLEKRLNGQSISSPDAAKKLFVARLANLPNEEFHVAFLDNRHKIIALEVMFAGSINQTSVFIRPILQAVFRHNAAAIILGHNHPSGAIEPSPADKHLTSNIKIAMNYIDVRVLDHFVVGGTKAYSMAEHGLI